jgi:hypothetical protein
VSTKRCFMVVGLIFLDAPVLLSVPVRHYSARFV